MWNQILALPCLHTDVAMFVKLPKIETNLADQAKSDADDAPQSVIHVSEGFKAFVCSYN